VRPATTHTTNSLNAFLAYRFHFNGKETDNEVYGEGNVYDYGARIYDSRLGRWLSVDGRAKDYVPFSPYIFALNSPIYFKDADGNVVVDGKGNPVTVSVTQASDGTATATFEFAEGTSQEVIDNFNNNAGRVIKSMIQTKTGRQIVDEMIKIKDHVKIEISDERPIGEDGNLKFGDTDIEAYGEDAKSGEPYKVLIIKIYHKNIDQATKDADSEQSVKWENAEMNKEQKIGAVGVHEGTHANKHYNGKGSQKARFRKENEAKAQEYNAIREYGELNN
jgi:RHS repeat-associated protein